MRITISNEWLDMDSSLNLKKKTLSERGRGLLSGTRYLKVEATSREIRRFKTDLMTRDNVRRVLFTAGSSLRTSCLYVRDSQYLQFLKS